MATDNVTDAKTQCGTHGWYCPFNCGECYRVDCDGKPCAAKAAADGISEASHRVELGCAGHLIVSNKCRWKRHTQVGNYRVSSIGDYYPDRDGKRDRVGSGPDNYFETMVFETNPDEDAGNEGCGCRAVKNWSEIDGERYATAGEAQQGHERYVEKYAALSRGTK